MYEVPYRIIVDEPFAKVAMRIQKGKDELLEPSHSDPSRLIFEFEVRADLSQTEPNFLGPFAHGPKGGRFIYLNSGSYAGQGGTIWARRAKISLVSVTLDMVKNVLDTPGSRLETTIRGIGSDGGPVCASVKGLEWTVSK